jgi:hypothetical protein
MHVADPMQTCGRQTRGGYPCKLRPMRGQHVCRMHGGSSPQALAKAEDRMRQLVHPAVSSLARQIETDQFAAVKYVLDWAGFRSETVATTDSSITVTVSFDHADNDQTVPTLALPDGS